VRQAEIGELVRQLRAVRRELEGLRQDERERARRIDLLTYQVGEIRGTRLIVGELEELASERTRLANAEQLAALSSEALRLLQGGGFQEGEQWSALDGLGSTEQALGRLARIDPSVEPLVEQLTEAVAQLDDLARALGHYLDGIEFNPQRLEQVEERLHLVNSLQRKYGDTLEDVLAYADRAAAELETISHADELIGDLEAKEQQLLNAIGRLGVEVSAARRAAAARMAQAIEAELGDLQMKQARFAVQITWKADDRGAIVDSDNVSITGEAPGRYAFDSHGLDSVAFFVSANPGEPLRPLVRVASGGETSHLMLALKTVLGRADETPTLIFDEIDQGIGGRVGGTVGRKLWGLTVQNDDQGADREGSQSARHQVLCITHLPQLAAYADEHFHVSKHVVGDRTMTTVGKLTRDERVTELAHMMGTASEAGRASVAEIMAEVARAKGGELV
jgi:DNA repair protein RecN (Recombination protein N)